MIPEIGHFALVLAFVIALFQGVLPLWGAWCGNARWMVVARPAAWGQFAFMVVSFAALVASFLGNDFTVHYVAMHSNSQLPYWYRIAATWGGHEGSLLLWGLVLAGWTAAVAWFSRSIPEIMVARVLGVLGLVATGFHSFMIFTSNPFIRSLPDFPPDGGDLNPLLQDPGLIVHPPMLYMGYVGFSVAFAFAIAGLLGGRLDSAWARWSRPWTTVAWCFLTGGIVLGSWWAYYELGWGGWWFWDPVENASFMPWLVGTALMHSLAATEKRGVFKQWTVLLAILAFSLSLLGTFLVRSGVLTSVHAFASDPARGTYILAFLCAVVGGSLTLFAWRASAFHVESHYASASRETFILANNVLLLTSAAYVLGGTLFPILAEAVGAGKVSVGAPFFNRVAGPLALLLASLTGIGPLLNWKRHSLKDLVKPVLVSVLLSVPAALAVVWLATRQIAPYAIVAVVFALVTMLLMGRDLLAKIRTAKGGWWSGWTRLSRSYRGMQLAHAGFVMTLLGVAFVSGFDVERDVRLSPGQTTDVSGYRFSFDSITEVQGPNYASTEGVFSVFDGDRKVAELRPEKRRYNVKGNVMTEAAIEPGVFRDLYVALGEPLGDGSWAVRVYYKPLMRWVWGGGLLMALGGVFALSDRRYRMAARLKTGAVAGRPV